MVLHKPKNFIVVEGKSLEDAIEKGMNQLRLHKDQIQVEILEKGQSVMDVVIKNFKVKLTSKEEKTHTNHPVAEELDLENEKISIEITQDALEAYMMIHSEEPITKEDIDKVLEKNQITYGIDQACIEDIVNRPNTNQKYKIAIGQQPIDGENGRIEYYFDQNKKGKPQIDEKGNVNFKELHLVQCVSKGEVLAKRYLPTKGIDGTNIRGKKIKAHNGKNMLLRKGRNVLESDDGLTFIAGENGQIELKDEKISILDVYEVDENVDHSTGNIYFNGNVIVKGNVRTGFKIESTGNVEVFGAVEGAIIQANGNIILHQGIKGHNKGRLISERDVVSKYIENSYVKAKGNIYADAIMHCSVQSKGEIVVSGKKGLIVGGSVRANEKIKAKCIGSSMATITKIQVGIDPELKEECEKLQSELDTLIKNRENIEKVIKLLTNLSQKIQLPHEKEEMLKKSMHTKVYLNDSIKANQKKLKEIEKTFQNLSYGRVDVESVTHSGVRISIGNAIYYVRDDLNYTTFIKNEGEIVRISYRG